LREVTGPDGLEWKVKLVFLSAGMRPPTPADLVDIGTPRRTHVDGVGRIPDAVVGVTGPVPLGALLLVLTLPFLPIVLALRWLRVLPWTIEARTYPWGKRHPPIVLSYEIRGRDEALRALDELAAALVRGDGAPLIPGAEFVRGIRRLHG
jgi:hypothetical protein